MKKKPEQLAVTISSPSPLARVSYSRRFVSTCRSFGSNRGHGGSVVSSLHCMSMTPIGGSYGNPHRPAKIYSPARRRSSCVAARGACAAAADASDWAPYFQGGRRLSAAPSRTPSRSERHGLCGGSKRHDRVSLCRESKRPATHIGGRSGSPPSEPDPRDHYHRGSCGKGSDHHHSDRFRNGQRSGPAGSRRQSQSARR